MFRWVRRLALAVVALAVALVLGTAGRVWWVGRQGAAPRCDAIVVLGAAQYDGRPSETLQARLDHALTLYRLRVAPRIVTVGGSRRGDRFTEAGAGERYLDEHGVTGSGVVAVSEGWNTLTSLEAASRLFQRRGWRSAVLVTDPWHALRSRRMARDLGIAAETSPTRTGPSVRSRGVELRYIARETLGYLWYRLSGSSVDSGPTRF